MRVLALILAVMAELFPPQARPAMPALLEWTAAVRQHDPGQSDQALSTITAWTYDDIEKMRPLLEKLVDAPTNTNYERGRRRSRLSPRDMEAIREALKLRGGMDFDTFRRRAAILHTDAALLGDPPKVFRQPTTDPRGALPLNSGARRVNVRSFDGRFESLEYSNPHWDLAMDMLDALPASPRDPFVGQWYAAIGTHLVQRRQFADALVHFNRARPLVPDDPRVLYSEARLHETLGSPAIQNYIHVTVQINGMSIRGVAPARTELRRAEELLQRALGADPSFVAARLRLGRVIMGQQRWDEGLRQVQQVLDETRDKALTYYGNLFGGDAGLALGNPGEARRSYERALRLFPDSQSARLGLAAALGSAGQRGESVTAILPTLTKLPEGRAEDDPWWIYYDSNLVEADAELDRLRAPFKAAGP
jgi:tetratricopeptide (TPR) repeat protein